jgi:hypothetical protein
MPKQTNRGGWDNSFQETMLSEDAPTRMGVDLKSIIWGVIWRIAYYGCHADEFSEKYINSVEMLEEIAILPLLQTQYFTTENMERLAKQMAQASKNPGWVKYGVDMPKARAKFRVMMQHLSIMLYPIPQASVDAGLTPPEPPKAPFGL